MPKLSQDDMRSIWVSVTDQGYSTPLLENDGSGVEAVEQAFAQYERASEAADRTFQSLFILPWSGQSDDPSSGGVKAQVVLRLTRTRYHEALLVLGTDLPFAHYPEEMSADGTVNVETGRRYFLAEPLVMLPGESGPFDADAEAEREGGNYNLPLSDSITLVVQPGVGKSNDEASVLVSGSANILRLDEEPDVISPVQVGQYVVFTGGSNAGCIRQIVDYQGAVQGVHGGDVTLDGYWLLEGSLGGGDPEPSPGDSIVQGTAEGRVVRYDGDSGRLVAENRGNGTFVAGASTLSSGGTFTITTVPRDAFLTPELATAEWAVVSWADVIGVTNPEQPSRGRSPTLDEVGAERKVYRNPGEGDDVYRQRVATPADVVSPNAIRRAANRVLAPLGISACLREVGTELLRGFFYDAGSSSDAVQNPDENFAYDMDPEQRPEDRFRVYLDLVEFRAFFMVGVPTLVTGDSGLVYDAIVDRNAYDALVPSENAYDGSTTRADEVYDSVYNSVDRARAAGVGFVLYLEDIGCY